MLVLCLHASILPVKILGQLLVDLLLDEDYKVFACDLEIDNCLADHGNRCEDVEQIEVCWLGSASNSSTEWIWHRHELIENGYEELLLDDRGS